MRQSRISALAAYGDFRSAIAKDVAAGDRGATSLVDNNSLAVTIEDPTIANDHLAGLLNNDRCIGVLKKLAFDYRAVAADNAGIFAIVDPAAPQDPVEHVHAGK